METLAREAEEAALRQIEREQAEALKHKLPDFWLPSLTPTYTSSGVPTSLADVKIQTTCHGGTPAHPLAYVLLPRTFFLMLSFPLLRRKNLIPVNFIWDKSAAPPRSVESTPAEEPKPNHTDEKVAICPSCKKTLSNSTLMYRKRSSTVHAMQPPNHCPFPRSHEALWSRRLQDMYRQAGETGQAMHSLRCQAG